MKITLEKFEMLSIPEENEVQFVQRDDSNNPIYSEPTSSRCVMFFSSTTPIYKETIKGYQTDLINLCRTKALRHKIFHFIINPSTSFNHDITDKHLTALAAKYERLRTHLDKEINTLLSEQFNEKLKQTEMTEMTDLSKSNVIGEWIEGVLGHIFADRNKQVKDPHTHNMKIVLKPKSEWKYTCPTLSLIDWYGAYAFLMLTRDKEAAWRGSGVLDEITIKSGDCEYSAYKQFWIAQLKKRRPQW